jgi:O-antigen ligase
MSHKPVARQLLAGPGGFPAPAGSHVDHPVRATTTPGRSMNPVVLSPQEIPRNLFSLEALLVLYMYAALYKGDPRFAWMPVDATALCFALSVLVGSFIIVRNPIPKRGWPIILAMLAFVTWWAVTLTWSPSRIYGPQKVFYLATLAFWGLITGVLIVGPDRERVRRLFTLTLLLSIWVGIESLLIYGKDPTQLYLPKSADYRAFGDYQSLAGIAGFGALIAFTAWLFGRRGSVANLLFLVLSSMLTFVLLNTGGKGATLITAACMLLALLVGLRVTRRKILYKRYQVSIIWLAVGLTAGISIVVATSERMPRSLERLSGMIEDGEFGGTAELRYEMYQEALGFLPDAPVLGHGAGGWPVIWRGVDQKSTPHNMFLEIAVEAGVVGLVLMMALLVVALRPVSIDRLRNDPLALCAFMLFVWGFMKAQLGPDVADNRVMFMMLGVLTGLMGRRSAASPVLPAGAALRTAPPLVSLNSGRSSIDRGRLGP